MNHAMHPPGGPVAGRKVAIIGGAASRKLAPYDDLTWDVWAFSSLRVDTPRITRWFEMHALGDLQEQLRRRTRYRRSFRNYLEFLRGLPCPVYMQHARPEIPGSVAYPLQDALESFGKCFTSTASYLLALAILEGCERIGVWGVELTARRVYARQRPGVEYLLGEAAQRGIALELPRGCHLRIPRTPVPAPATILYGYDWQSPAAWWRKARLRSPARSRRRPARARRAR